MRYIEIFTLLLATNTSASVHPDVVALAKALSENTGKEAQVELPKILQRNVLNYDQYRQIRFLREHALWTQSQKQFQAEFFHLGYLFQDPVQIHLVKSGKVSSHSFSRNYFQYGDLKFDDEFPNDLGFAGLRLIHPLNRVGIWDDLAVFQGASYFRFLGKNHSYGLSARGLAIDSAEPGVSEEFPRFSQFWLEEPEDKSNDITLHALLESTSVTGAYTFKIRPGETTRVDIDCRLFVKKSPASSFGIAPLTSMFWFGENTSSPPDDFRQEVHDSDGLLIKENDDRWTWRPLVHQKDSSISKFPRTNPKGFGLLQRDRNPDHYQDLANPYHRTPSLFIEPLHDWGEGEIRLSELSTNKETFDNIVLFWCPKSLPKAGDELSFQYRLYWTHETDLKLSQNQVIATRSGEDAFAPGHRLITIDFAGPDLGRKHFSGTSPKVVFQSEPKIKAAHIGIVPAAHADFWRVTLKLPLNKESPPMSQLRLHLTNDANQPISETWNYPLKIPSP